MRPSTTLALLFATTLSVSALGCRDAAPSGPGRPLDIRSGSGDAGDGSAGAGSGDASSDSSSTGGEPGGTPGTVDEPTRPDTAVQEPLPRPAAFTLQGVVLGATSTSDTTAAVRLAGVTANLYRVRAADGTAVQPEVLVGTAVTDANGALTFRDVPSAYYRLDVRAPAGSPYVDASRAIAPPSSSLVGVYVVLLRSS